MVGRVGQIERIRQTIGLPGVLEHAVRKSRGEDRSKVVVEGGEVAGQRTVKRQVGLQVITDAENVIGGRAQPAVHGSVVDFASSSRIGVVRIRMRAAYERREPISGMRLAIFVQIGKTSLCSVAAWKPPEKMIETAVFHHHDDDVIDPTGFR